MTICPTILIIAVPPLALLGLWYKFDLRLRLLESVCGACIYAFVYLFRQDGPRGNCFKVVSFCTFRICV